MDERQLQAKAAEIKMIILDVDGVMTDGRTFVNEQRIEAKAFSYRDGFGIYMASKVGIKFGIITGKKSPIVELRAEQLSIEEVHQGFENKDVILADILKRNGLNYNEVAYMGDDLFDIPVMRVVGLSATPADGEDEVKVVADWVAPRNGGHGAVRDFIKLILKAKGIWEEAKQLFTKSTPL
ncbi:MAG: HAD hydrolase family protein [Calditrichaeota bacterium]|nr:HAD hydrolase family protein [Calditrichota bacterium]